MRRAVLLLAALLLLTGCASRQRMADYAKCWQGFICNDESVQGVALDNGVERFKDGEWTEEKVRAVIDYIDDLTTFGLYITPCAESCKVCTPYGMHQYHYIGHCVSIASYCWCVFKYLGYPYNYRVLLVQDLYIYHALFVVELPDGTWLKYNTFNVPIWRNLEEIWYSDAFEMDGQHVYWPPINHKGLRWVR